jgi:hypothetical protein
MYQFTEMFGEINASSKKKTYRWRGLVVGMLAGFLPAWGLAHWSGWGTWFFIAVWIFCLPLGYGIGSAIKK